MILARIYCDALGMKSGAPKGHHNKCGLAIKWLTLLLTLVAPTLVWSNVDESQLLQDFYLQLQATPVNAGIELPFIIRSGESGKHLNADVYGVVEQSFDAVATALADPASWCKFIPLNLNVKSCTWQQRAGQTILTFYAGRKFYQGPEEAYQINYRYLEAARNGHYIKVELLAEEGPFGTRDYSIVLEAIPAENNTFVRLHFSYQNSLRSRIGTRTYLATLGQDKVGFSVQYYTDTGEPVYIKGIKGVIERSIMRYYLTLKAFLDTQHLSYDERFEARINTWFDLSEQYATQLHELERDEYLQAKRQEWNNQQQLQRMLLSQ